MGLNKNVLRQVNICYEITGFRWKKNPVNKAAPVCYDFYHAVGRSRVISSEANLIKIKL